MPDEAPAEPIACRSGCAACCIAPSISSQIPGMAPEGGYGKPAGVRCVQLDEQMRCRLFGRPERPAVCSSLRPSIAMCGSDRSHALRWLTWLEQATA